MRIVIALGGNALLRKGQAPEAAVQQQNIIRACRAIAEIAGDHDLIITHGNGPQVGLLALQAENYKKVKPYPLDILDAETEGMIGYQIAQGLANALRGREVVSVLTQVEVDPDDPAFARPSKPVGPIYPACDRQKLGDEFGWPLTEVAGGLRRVVPSPEPKSIVELSAIHLLVQHRYVVVCAGGGGIPVCADRGRELRGVAAVIDKDLTSALLAKELHAELLLLLTDVDAVYERWGSDGARPLRESTPEQLRGLDFEAGSMGPKVAAACAFVEAGGGEARIGDLYDLPGVISGHSGTRVRGDRDRTQTLHFEDHAGKCASGE